MEDAKVIVATAPVLEKVLAIRSSLQDCLDRSARVEESLFGPIIAKGRGDDPREKAPGGFFPILDYGLSEVFSQAKELQGRITDILDRVPLEKPVVRK